jgi:hypothetical protein
VHLRVAHGARLIFARNEPHRHHAMHVATRATLFICHILVHAGLEQGSTLLGFGEKRTGTSKSGVADLIMEQVIAGLEEACRDDTVGAEAALSQGQACENVACQMAQRVAVVQVGCTPAAPATSRPCLEDNNMIPN